MTDHHLNTWLRFYLALGASVTATELLRLYGTAETVYDSLPEIDASERFPGWVSEHLRRQTPAQAERILGWCREFDWRALPCVHPLYPQSLRDLRDYPPVIFALGDPQALASPLRVSVVGTRSASPRGVGAAYGLGELLAYNGVACVSGCALGIDSAAMEGAMDRFGPTIGVLGHGLGYQYMPERVFFRRRVRDNGVLITEMLPFEEASRTTFPRRNRLIAALGQCTVVVESEAKGGSMITAAAAQRLGRPVFAVSDEVVESEGCRQLIREKCRPVHGTEKIFLFLGDLSAMFEFESRSLIPFAEKPPKTLDPAKMSLADFAMLSRTSVQEAREVCDQWYRGENAPAPPAEPQKPAAPPEKTAEQKRLEKAAADAARREKLVRRTREEADRIAAEAAAIEGNERLIYELFADGQIMITDLLVDRSGLPVRDVMIAVTRLELRGLIRQLPNGGLRKAEPEDVQPL